MLVHWHDLSTAFVVAQRCAQNYACRVVRVNAYFTVKAAVFFNVALKQKHRSTKFRLDRRKQYEKKRIRAAFFVISLNKNEVVTTLFFSCRKRKDSGTVGFKEPSVCDSRGKEKGGGRFRPRTSIYCDHDFRR